MSDSGVSSSNLSGISYTSSGVKKLVHHNIHKENTSKALTKWLSPKDFKWMLSGASWILETQTYYLIGDDGSFCMVQMGYSNLTWPNTNCQVTARYYKPGAMMDDYVEGSVTQSTSTLNSNSTLSTGAKAIHKFETQTLSSLRMRLTDENTSCTLQTSSITMRTNGNSCRISTTENSNSSDDFSFKINYSITPATATQSSPFTLDLDFEPQSAPFQVSDGKIHFGATRADGFIEMKFIPSGRCQGIIQIDGECFNFRGTGICLRQFQGIRPHLATKRWNCAYFLESGKTEGLKSLFMIQMHTCPAYNGEIVNYGFYFDGKKLQAVTSKDDTITYAKTAIDPDNGYCIPEHFDYRWRGIDMDGKEFEATVSGTPTARMARIDLYENLPIVLRKIVEGITSARPYIYQNLNHEVEAVINGERVVGNLFQEFSFLSEEP